MTNTNTFRSDAKNAVAKTEKETYGRDIQHEDIEVVWMAYVLGNMKGLFVVPKDNQGRYYEVTYSSSNDRLYLDEYHKTGSRVIDLKGE